MPCATHLQAIEPFIVNYTADTAEIYWLAGETDKAIAMLQPFRPGRTMELALIESAAGRYHDAAAALREMPPSNWPDGLLEKAAKLLDAAPAQAPLRPLRVHFPRKRGQKIRLIHCRASAVSVSLFSMLARRNACWNITKTR